MKHTKKTDSNDYTKEEDYMLWQLHEIRHKMAKQKEKAKTDASKLIDVQLEIGLYGYTLGKKGNKEWNKNHFVVPIRTSKNMYDDFVMVEGLYMKFQEVFENSIDAWKKAVTKYEQDEKEKKVKVLSKSEQRRLDIQKKKG